MGETRPGLHIGCVLPFHAIGCPDYREDGKDWPTASESFTCPRCGITSHHPDDVKHGYCGRCHDWTGDEADDAEPGHTAEAGTQPDTLGF